VADAFNNRVQNSLGGTCLQWGTGGIDNGQFTKFGRYWIPRHVFVSDNVNQRIQKSRTGAFVLTLGSREPGRQFAIPGGSMPTQPATSMSAT